MKKIVFKLALVSFFLGCIFCVPQSGHAVDWYTANQATVAWTPVTTTTDGTPIAVGSVIKYQTYLADAVADPDKQNPIDTGIVDVPEKTFTLSKEGQFYAGTQSLRYFNGELIGKSKTISWSDDPIVCQSGKTFGMKYYLIPDIVTGMYPKTE